MIISTSTTSQPRQDLFGPYSAFDPADRGYVAEQVLPGFSVGEYTGLYPVIGREVWTTSYDIKASIRSESSQSDMSSSTDTFSLVEYRHKTLVTSSEARFYRSWFNAEAIAAQRIRGILELAREVDTAAAVFNTTTFATAGVNRTTLTTPWDVSAGTPVSDVQAAIYALQKNYGVMANALIITDYGVRKLMQSSEFRGYFTGYGYGALNGSPGTEAMKQIFGVENIIVPRGVKNSAKSGQTFSASTVWDEDYAMVCRIESGGDFSRPCLGRTLQLDGNMAAISSWGNPDPDGTWIRGTHVMTPKILTTPVGHLISNTKT